MTTSPAMPVTTCSPAARATTRSTAATAPTRSTGGAGDDNLTGGAGNDKMTGGTGTDKVNGGEGDDTFYYTAGDGDDKITGAGGTDKLVVTPNQTGTPRIYEMTATAAGFDIALTLEDGALVETVKASGVELVDLALVDDEGAKLAGALTGVSKVSVTGSDGANGLDLTALTSDTVIIAGLGAGDDTVVLGNKFAGAEINAGEGGETDGDTLDLSGATGPAKVNLALNQIAINGAAAMPAASRT